MGSPLRWERPVNRKKDPRGFFLEPMRIKKRDQLMRSQGFAVFHQLTNGDWAIKGFGLRTGEEVEVRKRNGTRLRVIVGKLLGKVSAGYDLACIERIVEEP